MRSTYACPEKIITNTINTNVVKISQSNAKNSLTIKNSNKKHINNNSIESNQRIVDAIKDSGVSQFNCNEMENNLNNKTIIIQTPKQNETKNKAYNSKFNSNNNNNTFYSPNKFQMSESKDFLGKKRHLSKVYQNMIDNNLKSAAGKFKIQ